MDGPAFYLSIDRISEDLLKRKNRLLDVASREFDRDEKNEYLESSSRYIDDIRLSILETVSEFEKSKPTNAEWISLMMYMKRVVERLDYFCRCLIPSFCQVINNPSDLLLVEQIKEVVTDFEKSIRNLRAVGYAFTGRNVRKRSGVSLMDLVKQIESICTHIDKMLNEPDESDDLKVRFVEMMASFRIVASLHNVPNGTLRVNEITQSVLGMCDRAYTERIEEHSSDEARIAMCQIVFDIIDEHQDGEAAATTEFFRKWSTGSLENTSTDEEFLAMLRSDSSRSASVSTDPIHSATSTPPDDVSPINIQENLIQQEEILPSTGSIQTDPIVRPKPPRPSSAVPSRIGLKTRSQSDITAMGAARDTETQKAPPVVPPRPSKLPVGVTVTRRFSNSVVPDHQGFSSSASPDTQSDIQPPFTEENGSPESQPAFKESSDEEPASPNSVNSESPRLRRKPISSRRRAKDTSSVRRQSSLPKTESTASFSFSYFHSFSDAIDSENIEQCSNCDIITVLQQSIGLSKDQVKENIRGLMKKKSALILEREECLVGKLIEFSPVASEYKTLHVNTKILEMYFEDFIGIIRDKLNNDHNRSNEEHEKSWGALEKLGKAWKKAFLRIAKIVKLLFSDFPAVSLVYEKAVLLLRNLNFAFAADSAVVNYVIDECIAGTLIVIENLFRESLTSLMSLMYSFSATIGEIWVLLSNLKRCMFYPNSNVGEHLPLKILVLVTELITATNNTLKLVSTNTIVQKDIIKTKEKRTKTRLSEMEAVNFWDEWNLEFEKEKDGPVSLNQLIALTTLTQDHQFAKSVTRTFRTFADPLLLMRKLIERCNPPVNKNITAEITAMIRIRSVVTIDTWMSGEREQFDVSLIPVIEDFIKFLETEGSENMANKLKKGIKTIAKWKALEEDEIKEKLKILHYSLPKDAVSPYSLIELFSPGAVAEQLTLYDQQIFLSIRPTEFCGIPWSKQKLRFHAFNLRRLIKACNDLSFYVATSVLLYHSAEQRAKCMEKFIEVANKLYSLRNFSSLMGIIGGLTSGVVDRLKKTKQQISESSMNSLLKLKAIMNAGKNWASYRAELGKQKQTIPVIPYIGVFLTDLTFISDGNPDFVEENKINVPKFKLMSRTFSQIEDYQVFTYDIQPSPVVQTIISHLPYLDERSLYELSLLREPKLAAQ